MQAVIGACCLPGCLKLGLCSKCWQNCLMMCTPLEDNVSPHARDQRLNVTFDHIQDKTMRVWDVRKLGESLALVKGNMAAIRSIRFTSDGKFCAAAEAGDFVHIMDVASCFTR